jgi:myosin protein heavy chain
MVEYLQIACPSCQRTLRVRKQYVGLTVACSHCGNNFPVEQPPEPSETGAPAERPAPQAVSETDHESYEKRIAELARALEEKESEVQQGRDERTLVTEQLQQRDAERNRLGNQIKALTDELEQLREQAQVDAVLRDELADSGAEVERLRAQIQSLESRAAVAESLEQELQSERAARGRLSEQVQKLSEELERTRVERNHLAEHGMTHKTELDRLRTSLTDLERSSEAEQASLEASSAQLKQAFDDARMGWGTEREVLEKQVGTATRQAAATTLELEKLRNERDQLAAQCAAKDASIREAEKSFATEVEQLRQEVATLRQERDRVSQEAKQAHHRADELAEEIRSLESKLAQRPAPIDIAADQQPAGELRNQLRALEIQNEELRSVIRGLGITVG